MVISKTCHQTCLPPVEPPETPGTPAGIPPVGRVPPPLPTASNSHFKPSEPRYTLSPKVTGCRIRPVACVLPSGRRTAVSPSSPNPFHRGCRLLLTNPQPPSLQAASHRLPCGHNFLRPAILKHPLLTRPSLQVLLWPLRPWYPRKTGTASLT